MGFFKKTPKEETVERANEIAREPQLVSEGKMEFYTIKTKEESEEERWEHRRWELTKYLVAQDRRSVVLGKLNMSDKAIARKARQLADATINELRKHKIDSNGDQE